jgi:hypothetical protein
MGNDPDDAVKDAMDTAPENLAVPAFKEVTDAVLMNADGAENPREVLILAIILGLLVNLSLNTYVASWSAVLPAPPQKNCIFVASAHIHALANVPPGEPVTQSNCKDGLALVLPAICKTGEVAPDVNTVNIPGYIVTDPA